MTDWESSLHVEVALEEGLRADDMVPAVEAAGLYEANPLNYRYVILGRVGARETIEKILEVTGVREVIIEREVYQAKREAERLGQDPDFQAEVRQLTEDARNGKLPPADSLKERRDRARPA